MSGERVNLSAIILGHMQYCQSHDTHALLFPHVIKKILTKLNLYPSDVSEKKVPMYLNMIVVRRLLADEEEKVTAEAPPPTAMISVPNTTPKTLSFQGLKGLSMLSCLLEKIRLRLC